ncbi:unnamed protein product [Citrullus colocynthis]|uniref:Secreted protein n=1 Tax=Citrullus colocynthis TaxID=252529 RepID=A0ABP0ZE19_9ROSI
MVLSLSLSLVFVVATIQLVTTVALQSAAPLFNNFFWAIGVHVVLVNRLQVVVDQASGFSCVVVICRFALSHQHHCLGLIANYRTLRSELLSLLVVVCRCFGFAATSIGGLRNLWFGLELGRTLRHYQATIGVFNITFSLNLCESVISRFGSRFHWAKKG